jgi:class 3 adenylate cyclase
MAEKTDISPVRTLHARYEEALVASGLVDDVADIMAVCRHGDIAEGLWVIVSGSISVREHDRTLFVRRRHEVVGEQSLLGNGCQRWYDLVVSESQAELLEVNKTDIERHPQSDIIWRNIAKIISLKLKDASVQTSTLSRQLEDDTRILHAYMNDYALSRRLQSGGGRLTDYHVDRAIVWFSDVVDFSQYVLELAPSRTADVVQRFFNAQSIPISTHGGHIDKFIGDGLMAFWPLAESEAASTKCLEALRAAEEAVKAVSGIRIGNNPLHLRLGLHIGLVLSGDFGSAARHQFTLIGPEVNKAVHAEDITEGKPDIGPIRLSVEFREELTDLTKKRYARRSTAKAKNIGEIELYS